MVIMSNPMYGSVYWLYNMNKWVKCLIKSLPGLACRQDGRNWARIDGNLHSGALLMLDIVGSVQPLIRILYLFLHLENVLLVTI